LIHRKERRGEKERWGEVDEEENLSENTVVIGF